MKSLRVLFPLSYVLFFFISSHTQAQEFSAGINTETPNPNAVLHLVSPGNDQGILIPRLTSGQRTSMGLNADDRGLMVYDETDNRFYFWDGGLWQLINVGGTTGITVVNSDATLTGDGNGTPLGVANDAITSARIVDGSITNADVSATATIAGTKINPDFGGQNITTTGVITGDGSGITNLPVPTAGS